MIITSEAYTIHITVNDVTTVLNDHLSSRIERYFRVAAQNLIIAISLTEEATFDLVCAIRYPRAFKKQDLKQHLKSRITLPSFGEPEDIGGRILHVDAKPYMKLDDFSIPATARIMVRESLVVGLLRCRGCCWTRCKRSEIPRYLRARSNLSSTSLSKQQLSP